MFPVLPPEPDPGSFVCASCGTPRITSAAEPCFQCGTRMPRFYGRVPGKSGREMSAHVTNPIWVILGAMHLCCLAVALVFIGRVPVATVCLLSLLIMMVPALFLTISRSNQQVREGRPFTVPQWFGVLLGYLGKESLAVMALYGVASIFIVRLRLREWLF
jgi:hypothetical protein